MDDELQKEVWRWCRYAREDLRTAQHLMRSEGIPRHSAWLAQQAAEKALKVVLIRKQIDFPRTHNLNTLRGLIPSTWTVASLQVDLESRSQFAVESRYPENVPDVTEEEAQAGADDAQRLVEAVLDDLDV